MVTAKIGSVRKLDSRIEVRADFTDGPPDQPYKHYVFEARHTIDDVMRAIGRDLVAFRDETAIKPLHEAVMQHVAAGTVITPESIPAA